MRDIELKPDPRLEQMYEQARREVLAEEIERSIKATLAIEGIFV